MGHDLLPGAVASTIWVRIVTISPAAVSGTAGTQADGDGRRARDIERKAHIACIHVTNPFRLSSARPRPGRPAAADP